MAAFLQKTSCCLEQRLQVNSWGHLFRKVHGGVLGPPTTEREPGTAGSKAPTGDRKAGKGPGSGREEQEEFTDRTQVLGRASITPGHEA